MPIDRIDEMIERKENGYGIKEETGYRNEDMLPKKWRFVIM